MTRRPVVVVWRAANADHLPGIEAAGTVADIRFAPDASALRPALDEAEVLFFHHGSKPELEAAWRLQQEPHGPASAYRLQSRPLLARFDDGAERPRPRRVPLGIPES